MLFFSGRPGGHCGFVPLVVPRSRVQGTAGALSLLTATAKGIKQSFFFFLPGTPKWWGWDSPRHPPLSAGSILATQLAPRGLSRGVQRPQRPISNPARALVSRRLHLLISETHLRSSLGKQLRFLKSLPAPHKEIFPPQSISTRREPRQSKLQPKKGTAGTLEVRGTQHCHLCHRIVSRTRSDTRQMHPTSRGELPLRTVVSLCKARMALHRFSRELRFVRNASRLGFLTLFCQLNSASVKCDRTIREGGNENPRSDARAPGTRPRGVLCQSKLKVIS